MVSGPENEFDSDEFKDNSCESSVFRVQSSKLKVRDTVDEARDDSTELRNEVVMPPEFYMEVDNFLCREPPKLRKESLASTLSSFSFSSTGPKSTYSNRASKPSQTEKAGLARKVIDENLLRDAFAYRTAEDIDDEEEGVNKSHRKNDKGRARKEDKGSSSRNDQKFSKGEDTGAGTGAGTASRGGNSSGIVQKLRSQTASSSNSRCSSPTVRRSISKDTGTDGYMVSDGAAERGRQNSVSGIRKCSTGNSGGHDNINSNSIDVEGIVSDFESGSTVKRLQKELVASKHSLDRSTKAIEIISNSYLREDLGSRK